MSRGLAVIVVCLGVSASPPARGEGGRSSALALWDEAQAAWERGELVRAEAGFERSYLAEANGRTACDLARLLAEDGHGADAATWFRRCAADDRLPDAERAEAADRARHLEHSVATLRLECDAEGPRAQVDGVGVHACPLGLELTLPPGRHRVEVQGGPGGPSLRSIELFPARSTTVRVDEPVPLPHQRTRHLAAWAFWTTLGAALAVAAGAGVGEWYAREAWSDFHNWRTDRYDLGPLGGTAALWTVAGLALAAAFTMLPYVLAPEGAERGEP